MSEAFMVRGSERQRFLESVKRTIMDKEDALEDQFEFSQENLSPYYETLSKVLMAYLIHGEDWEIFEFRVLSKFRAWVRDFVREAILPSVAEFSRVEEERKALLASLLEWTVGVITKNSHSALLRKEMMDPQSVFRAESAMTKIEG